MNGAARGGMATITVQVGQCGNQLGPEVLDALSAASAHGGNFFRRTQDGASTARAVLVDSEPRAVDCALSTARSWRYDRRRRVDVQAGGMVSARPACPVAASPRRRHRAVAAVLPPAR